MLAGCATGMKLLSVVADMLTGMQASDSLAVALGDHRVRERFCSKVVHVPGSECWWWLGAISGRGHGRFWITDDLVVIAHRFAYAMTHGADALEDARLLGHRCDNPLCQRIDGDHVAVSTARRNRREWLSRRFDVNSPLSDPRGARARAEVLRSLARLDPISVQAEIELVRASLPEQLALF